MTRSLVFLTAASCLVMATAKADYYYNSQGGYYRPDYAVPPPLPPPSYTSVRTAPPPGMETTYNAGATPGVDDGFDPGATGPYFRGEIGPSLFSDTRLTHFGVPANDKTVFKPGLALDAAGGYYFNQNISADFEVGFIGAEVDHINFFTFDEARYMDIPLLVNVMASMPLRDGHIVPYVGAGVGGAVAIFDTENLTTPANPTISGTKATGVVAGQIFLGARFQLNSRMWIGAGYKYFTTGDPTWTYPGNFKFGMKGVDTHSFQFTFLWKF